MRIDLQSWREMVQADEGFRGFEAAPPPSEEDTHLYSDIQDQLYLMYQEAKLLQGAKNPGVKALKEEVDTLRKDILSAPPEHRLKIAAAAVVRWPYTSGEGNKYSKPRLSRDGERRIHQVIKTSFPYPCADIDPRARIVLGESPQQLSRVNRAEPPLLSKRDAHMWLSCEPTGVWIDHPGLWYATERLGMPDETPMSNVMSSRRGLEWLANVWGHPGRRAALLRDRTELGPRGRPIEGSFLSRLDELHTRDLVGSVEGSFRNARERITEEDIEYYGLDEELAKPPPWWVDSPHAQLLDTRRKLETEGDEMRHCVGEYPASVAENISVVVSIKTPDCRSTVELHPKTLQVLQHVGRGNRPASYECDQILEKLLLKWEARNKKVRKR